MRTGGGMRQRRCRGGTCPRGPQGCEPTRGGQRPPRGRGADEDRRRHEAEGVQGWCGGGMVESVEVIAVVVEMAVVVVTVVVKVEVVVVMVGG